MTSNDAEMSTVVPCPYCGATSDSTWSFCGTCGKPVAVAMPELTADPDGAGPAEETKVLATVPTGDLDASKKEALVATNSEPGTLTLAPGVGAFPSPTVGGTTTALLLAVDRVPTPDPSGRHLRKWLKILGVVAVVALLGLLVADDLGLRSDLAASRRRLSATNSTLASTANDLVTTKLSLSSTQSNLVTTTSDRDNLKSQLASTQSELAGVRGTLSDTQNQLNLKAGQLAELKTCLDGVSTALDGVLNSDYTAALAALQAVQTACTAARSAVGG